MTWYAAMRSHAVMCVHVRWYRMLWVNHKYKLQLLCLFDYGLSVVWRRHTRRCYRKEIWWVRWTAFNRWLLWVFTLSEPFGWCTFNIINWSRVHSFRACFSRDMASFGLRYYRKIQREKCLRWRANHLTFGRSSLLVRTAQLWNELPSCCTWENTTIEMLWDYSRKTLYT